VEVRLDWFVRIGFIALMAIVGLAGILLRSRARRLALAFVWVSAVGMALGALVPPMPGLGLPALFSALMLIISAIGLTLSWRAAGAQAQAKQRGEVGFRKTSVVLGAAGGVLGLGGTILMAATISPGVRETITTVYFGIAGTTAIAALVAVGLGIAHLKAARPLMWTAAVIMGLAGLIPDPFSFGFIYIPAALLLVASAASMGRS
jgi:hypothetical protein